jgi:uncharacterized membrane protein YuzA (DUF378 family)
MVHFITFVLIIAGSFNWVLYGFVGWHLGYLLGPFDGVLYGAIGAAAVYEVLTHKKYCSLCATHTHETTGKQEAKQSV